MKATNIKQLILNFIGGGKIKFPTRFLKSIDIESPDIKSEINPDEILDLEKEIFDIFGKDIKNFEFDDTQNVGTLGEGFNLDTDNGAYMSFKDNTIDGNYNPDFIDKFTNNIKYISINNINFKIVRKHISDMYTMTVICNQLTLYITQGIIQIAINLAVNNYTGE